MRAARRVWGCSAVHSAAARSRTAHTSGAVCPPSTATFSPAAFTSACAHSSGATRSARATLPLKLMRLPTASVAAFALCKTSLIHRGKEWRKTGASLNQTHARSPCLAFPPRFPQTSVPNEQALPSGTGLASRRPSAHSCAVVNGSGDATSHEPSARRKDQPIITLPHIMAFGICGTSM